MRRDLVFALSSVLVVACAQATSAPVAAPAQADAAHPSYVESLHARLGGSGVTLTLVPHLQAAAEKAVLASGKAAALVALAPDTGDVLALFSVAGERGDPLLVAHEPASTIKPLITFAALEASALTPSTVKQCTGKYDFEGQTFTCHSVHGSQDAAKANATSCNTFFYEVSTAVAPERVRDVARRFGYGERTGIELEDEPGQVPEPTEARRAERLLDSVGHGKYRVTLLQLARAYAAIANGGNLVRLGVVQGRKNSHGTLLPVKRQLERVIEFQPAHLELVRRGLLDAVAADYGTAHAFSLPDSPFAGKTGTGDAPPRPGSAPAAEPDADSWMVAYAPAKAPKIVVAARIERKGSIPAAALVKAVLEAWRDAS